MFVSVAATVRAHCVYICGAEIRENLVLTFLADKEENAFFSQPYATRESESLVCSYYYFYDDGAAHENVFCR